jgi:hypothetical protein
MKQIFKKISFLFLAIGVTSTAYSQLAQVQIIHNCADPGAASVDIYVNGTLSLDNFNFREATSFIDLPAGTLINVGVASPTSTSVDDTLINFPLTLTDGSKYYVVASGVLDPTGFAANPASNDINFGLKIYDQALTSTDPTTFGLQLLHGATDAPDVDLYYRQAGIALFANQTYGTYGIGYLDAPTSSPLILDLTPAGASSTIVATYLADLAGLEGQTGLAFASGFLDPTTNQNGPAFGVFVALTNGTVVQLNDTSIANLQVIHNAADPSAAVVDIYLNGSLLLNDFAFRTATPFVQLPGGVPLAIGVAPGNSTSSADIIATFNATLDNNKDYTAIANGVLAPPSFAVNPDAVSTGFNLFINANAKQFSTDITKTEFSVFHGATDAPTVDVKLHGTSTILVDDAAYTDQTPYIEVAAGSYDLDVTPGNNNNVIVASYTADLSTLAGQAFVVFASGFLTPSANQNGEAFGLFAALPNGTVLELPTFVPTAFVQVIHNAADPGAAVVDIYVDGTLALNDFAFRTATDYVELPITASVAVAPGTSTSVTDALATFPLNLVEGSYNIAIANGVLAPASFAANPDAQSTGFTLFLTAGKINANNANKVEFKVVHGSTDAPTVDVVVAGTSTILVDNAKYSDITAYIEVDPITYTINVTPGNDNNTIVKTYQAPLASAQGFAAVVFASGFLNPAANQNGPAFGLYATTPQGLTFPLLDVTGVEDITLETSVFTYPNPATDFLVINNNSNLDLRAELYDVTGRLVKELGFVNKNNFFSVNVSEFSNGIYNVRVTSENGVANFKTVINN